MMGIMWRFLSITVFFLLVITGMVFLGLENSIEKELEQAIIAGYPGTGNVEVKLTIDWLKGGLKGNIARFNVHIANWRHKNWYINNFYGDFTDVKINWLQLYRKKQLVIEKLGQGDIEAVMDENNLNKVLNKYHQGLTIELTENKVNIKLKVQILGYSFMAAAKGQLLPGQGPEIYFVPDKVDIGKYQVPESIQKELLKKLKIPLALEKTPFTFQVTTVKILQDKIIIQGKV